MFLKEKCPQSGCSATISKGQNFCGVCGVDLQNTRQAEIQNNAWQARDDEFAGRINAKDLKKLFRGTQLNVATGSQAYIFNQGQVVEVKKAGKHKLSGMLKSKADEAIVFREAPLNLSFDFYELLSKDYLPLNFSTSLAVQIVNPEKFISNYMGGNRNTVTIANIKDLLSPIIKQIIGEQLQSLDLDAITNTQNLRTSLTRSLSDGMKKSLSRYGLEIDEISSLTVSQTDYDENNKIVAQSWLEADRQEKEMQAKHSLEKLKRNEDRQAIEQRQHSQQIKRLLREISNTDREDDYTQKLRDIDLYERISQAESREQAIAAGVQVQAEQLADEAKKRQGLREEAQLDWQQVRQLAQMQRDKALEQTAELNRHEMQRILTENRFNEAMQQRQAEIEIAKLNDSEAARTFQARLEGEKRQAEHDREQERLNLIAELDAADKRFKQKLSQQQAEADADYLERERDIILGHKKAMLELDEWERFTEINIKNRQTKSQIKQGEKDKAHGRKMAEWDKLNQLSLEALIHLSDIEQGEIIAGLRQTEIMKGFTEEQILAMAAKDSPQIAEALKQRFVAENENVISEREKILYERMISAANTAVGDVKDMAAAHSRDLMESQKNLANTSVDMARALSGNAAVQVPQGGVQQEAVQPVQKIKVCTNCQRENQADYRVCAYCGMDL